MQSYKQLLQYILDKGKDRTDRTGTGTRAVFGCQWRHNLKDGFPLLTTKKVHWRSIAIELAWFLRGDTNIAFLKERGVTIWNEWADESGNLGPVYGKQWRDFGGVDQIQTLLDTVRKSPDSRRLIVSAWNPQDVPRMKLPPCHTLWQCQVEAPFLHLHLYARSIDSFLGLPFNIASYALLLMLLARVSGYEPGELIISFGDLHIYSNHMEQVFEQLAREPRELPRVDLSPRIKSACDLVTLENEDFELVGYNPHPPIKAPVAV
jgi:thymidylate synthase